MLLLPPHLLLHDFLPTPYLLHCLLELRMGKEAMAKAWLGNGVGNGIGNADPFSFNPLPKN